MGTGTNEIQIGSKLAAPYVKRRILIFVTFANVAGAQIAALRLANGFKDRGHETRVVFLYQQTPIQDPYHSYEVILPKDRPGVKGYVKIACDAVKIVREYKPDVLLSFLPLAHAIGQGAALLGGVKGRIAAHRMPIDTAQKPLRVADLLYAWTGIYSNFTAVSRSVMDTCKYYPKWLKQRGKLIYNGLVDWKASHLSSDEARAKFGITPGKTVLVTVGRFVAQKNYPLLLSIMCELDDTVVVVAGDGPLRQPLEAQIDELGIRDKVILLGNLTREEVPHLLAAGDMFIQTSNYEGNSNSMLEALASGSVILAHDVPEQREVLANEETGEIAGALVPLGDKDAWVSTIKAFASNPAARERVQKLAKQRATFFSYDKMIDEYEKVVCDK